MSGKDSLQTKIESQLEEWETNLKTFRGKLEELQAKAEELTGEARIKYLEHIRVLEDRINATQNKMDLGKKQIQEMKASAGDAWEEMKEGGQDAWADLKTGIGNAWKELTNSMDVAARKFENFKGNNKQ
ncbi:MAG: hypothetical protein KC643_32585 [Nitrospira sp.]|nr:hypothetical protein [Nitrospira sp.]